MSIDAAIDEASQPLAPTEPKLAFSTPFGLTSREMVVLREIAAGRTDREIGEALSGSRRTVAAHVEHILGKLNVPSRSAAVARGYETGLLGREKPGGAN